VKNVKNILSQDKY